MNTGQQMWMIADGAWPLTYHATTNKINGGVSHTCEAGDLVHVFKDLSAIVQTTVVKANGTAVVSAGSHGQCQLSKSGANLILLPKNGNRIIVNGVSCTVPDAGVTLAAPATSGTTYLIYAYMNGGTMTLEASATAHATDATTGVEIKSGDATRTLVGIARTVSSAWVDTATQRFVRSYFNRTIQKVANAFTTSRSTTSTTS